MNQIMPVRAELIYLGNDDSPNEPPLGSPVRDVPPFEVKDVPPREPMPWVAPQPNGPDDYNDGSADA